MLVDDFVELMLVVVASIVLGVAKLVTRDVLGALVGRVQPLLWASSSLRTRHGGAGGGVLRS